MLPLHRGYDLAARSYRLRSMAGNVMAIADDVRKCVLFIGHGDEGNFKSCGTAFLLGYKGTTYLVTARHVALALGDDPFSFRLNLRNGLSDTIHHDPLGNKHEWFRWHVPHDPTVDLAVKPFNFAFGSLGYEIKALKGSDWILDDVKRAEEHIGPGDLCYAIGLFHLVQGTRRNVPIVHTGRIAMNSGEELVPVEDWTGQKETVDVNGYLVELTNLEGLSGAPVLVRGEFHVDEFYTHSGEQRGVSVTDTRLHLLGVWQGSWNHSIHDGRRPLAIGVVVPASELLKLLEQDDVAAARAAFDAALALREAASLDSGKG